MSYTIHKYNKAANSTDINLKGLAIGNGLTDPAIQYGAYADFALLNNLVPKPVHDAMKLVSSHPFQGLPTAAKYGFACLGRVHWNALQSSLHMDLRVKAYIHLWLQS